MDTNDILATTTNTIYRFMEQKNWGDILILYMRYMIQSRLQNTSNTYSNDVFMIKAMWWWKERFAKAKTYLVDTKTIEPIARRDEAGRIVWHFVRVKYDIGLTEPSSPQPSFATHWEKPPSGKQETNTIVENINTIVEKENTIEETKVSKAPRISFIDVNNIIDTFKEKVKVDWYIYSNVKERMFASNLVRNKEWKEAQVSYNMSPQELITYIMTYANSKWCWYMGKICSIQTLYYKWAIILSEMKTKSVAVPLNAKQEEEKKRQAEAFFNSL